MEKEDILEADQRTDILTHIHLLQEQHMSTLCQVTEDIIISIMEQVHMSHGVQLVFLYSSVYLSQL